MCECRVGSVAQLCPTLCDPIDCSPPGSSFPGNSPGEGTGAGCHFLLQGIFLTQGLNLSLLCLLHWQVDFLFFFKPVSHLGSLIPKEGTGIHPVGGKEQVLPGESACAKALR